MKKTYLVSMNHSCGTCANTYRARTPLGAIVQAVLQYHHLGVRFKTVTSVLETAK